MLDKLFNKITELTLQEKNCVKYKAAAYYMDGLKMMCREIPTCEGCLFNKEHEGCMFKSKTPREW